MQKFRGLISRCTNPSLWKSWMDQINLFPLSLPYSQHSKCFQSQEIGRFPFVVVSLLHCFLTNLQSIIDWLDRSITVYLRDIRTENICDNERFSPWDSTFDVFRESIRGIHLSRYSNSIEDTYFNLQSIYRNPSTLSSIPSVSFWIHVFSCQSW